MATVTTELAVSTKFLVCSGHFEIFGMKDVSFLRLLCPTRLQSTCVLVHAAAVLVFASVGEDIVFGSSLLLNCKLALREMNFLLDCLGGPS